MVTQQVTRSFGFLKTTAIGGLFFLLPLIVIAVLLGQVLQVVAWVAGEISKSDLLPDQSPRGFAIVFLAALALIILACFFCGVLARRSLARKFTRSIEKYLLMLFPRYAIFKEQLSGNIGGQQYKTRLTPVLVQFHDYQRVAFEVEKNRLDPATASELVTVYLPGSPDPWNGTVLLVKGEQVSPLATDFLTACGAFETLGDGMQKLLTSHSA